MEILSHYTGRQGLVGIVHSQSFRATHFSSLNDRTEFVYAMSRILDDALMRALSKIPGEFLRKDIDLSLAKILIEELKAKTEEALEQHNGYGALYVTSFARGKNEDEDERGILTLWDRYTRNEGYCIQFDFDDINRIVDFESKNRLYSLIEISEVKYGIDKNDNEFKWISDQYSYRILQFVANARPDLLWAPNPREATSDAEFLMRVSRYCGTHKDPAFSDEREVRILAYPEKYGQFNTLSGAISEKKIYDHNVLSNKRRYIVFGEGMLPGVVPNRVLIGPRADSSFDILDALHPFRPAIKKSDIPIL